MNMKNSPYTIVVTGANGIIGNSVCKLALAKGHNVAAFDLEMNNLSKDEEQYKDQILLIPCDVRKKQEIETGFSKVLSKWGRANGLFNNAAWKGSNISDFFQKFEEYSLSTWKEILSVNLDAVMLVNQVIGSYMANSQGYGSIVHTASIYGIQAPDQRIYEGSFYLNGKINSPAVYSASKGAVIAMAQYLAAYWGHTGVRVNSISPGGVESGQNDVFQKKYSSKVPIGRMASSEEIAKAVLFLLSDESSYINGHNLVVDGGLTIW